MLMLNLLLLIRSLSQHEARTALSMYWDVERAVESIFS